MRHLLAQCEIDASCVNTSEADLETEFDCLVIGGGPAGVAGALKAAYLGRRVLIVDKPKAAPEGGGLDPFFGGPTGLFSKALRDCAKSLDINVLTAQRLDDDVIWHQVGNSCLKLATNNATSVIQTLARFKVKYLQGEATLESVPKSSSEESFVLRIRRHDNGQITQAKAKRVLLCTGSKANPYSNPSLRSGDPRVFDSDTINGLSFLPKSVAIVGAGIVAIEYANIFSKLGAKVMMLVRKDSLKSLKRIGLDTDLCGGLLDTLKNDGVKVLEHTSISEFEESDSGPLKITLESPDGTLHVTSDILLAVIGRSPNTKVNAALGLAEANVTLGKKGEIITNERMQTNIPGLYAAGDCVGGAMLASTGVDQAQRAVGYMFNAVTKTKERKSHSVGIWTIPEVGYYGLTKEAALEQGLEVEEGVATYDQCLRGRVFSPFGLLKIVFDVHTSKILGVHIIGTDACEMVHYGMDLVDKEATIFDVISSVFTAVTFHELFKEAALNGNSKLEFGIQWQEVLQILAMGLPKHGANDEVEIRRLFDEIDTEGKGHLSEEMLVQALQKLHPETSPNTVASLMYLIDEDGNGTIEWEEFRKIFRGVKRVKKRAHRAQALKHLPAVKKPSAEAMAALAEEFDD